MARVDLAAAVVWVLLAVGIAIESVRVGVWDPSGPSRGFMPLLAAVVLGAAGLGLVLQRRHHLAGVRFSPGRRPALRVAAVLVGLAAMALLMPILGFLAAAIPVMAFLLSVIERQRWTWVVGTAVVSSVGLYWLFDRVLGMALPKSPFGF